MKVYFTKILGYSIYKYNIEFCNNVNAFLIPNIGVWKIKAKKPSTKPTETLC